MTEHETGDTSQQDVIRNTVDSMREPISTAITDKQYKQLGGMIAKDLHVVEVDYKDDDELEVVPDMTYDQIVNSLTDVIHERAQELRSGSPLGSLITPDHLTRTDYEEPYDSLADIKSHLGNSFNDDGSIMNMTLIHREGVFIGKDWERKEDDFGLAIYEGLEYESIDIDDTDEDASGKVQQTYAVDHQEIFGELEDESMRTNVHCTLKDSGDERLPLMGQGLHLEFTDTQTMTDFFNACISGYSQNERGADFFARVIAEFNSEEVRAIASGSIEHNDRY